MIVDVGNAKVPASPRTIRRPAMTTCFAVWPGMRLTKGVTKNMAG